MAVSVLFAEGGTSGLFRTERRVEDRRAAGLFEIAAETKLDLRSVKRRRGQVAAEWIDMQDREGVTGDLDHVVETLTEPLERREFVDPLDAGGLGHGGVVHQLGERMIEVVGRAIDTVGDDEVL